MLHITHIPSTSPLYMHMYRAILAIHIPSCIYSFHWLRALLYPDDASVGELPYFLLCEVFSVLSHVPTAVCISACVMDRSLTVSPCSIQTTTSSLLIGQVLRVDVTHFAHGILGTCYKFPPTYHIYVCVVDTIVPTQRIHKCPLL